LLNGRCLDVAGEEFCIFLCTKMYIFLIEIKIHQSFKAHLGWEFLLLKAAWGQRVPGLKPQISYSASLTNQLLLHQYDNNQVQY